MLNKWLGLGAKPESENHADGKSSGAPGLPNGAHETKLKHELQGLPYRKAVASPQGDFLPLEDIYRASGMLDASGRYNIHKVGEMFSNNHIRQLPNDVRRVSVLMALEAAGIPVQEVLKDAKVRLNVLASYEAEQEKRIQEYENRKNEENSEIQAELERLTEHYLERIKRNLDEAVVMRNPFSDWQALKQEEVDRISEVVALCENRPDLEPIPAPSSEIRAIVVAPERTELASNLVSGARGQRKP